jgi:hypothetical protein
MPIDPTQSAFMLGVVARLALAAIFALTASEAMRNWSMHAASIEQYKLLPEWMVQSAARILPALSCMTALLLLPPATASVGALLGLTLMVIFTLAVSINLVRGRAYIDCGCGGATGQRLSSGLVARNLVLIGLLLGALAAPSRGLVDPGFVTGVLGGSGALVALYFAANQLLTNMQALKGLDSGR